MDLPVFVGSAICNTLLTQGHLTYTIPHFTKLIQSIVTVQNLQIYGTA